MTGLHRALFLDRDGVVNKELSYLFMPSQVEFVPGIFELCQLVQGQDFKLIIITNQAGIARQLYTEADFHALMDWIIAQFATRGVEIDSYYYCPHHPQADLEKYRRDCPNRKPKPGMLLQAARERSIDLSRSVLVGDRCTDMAAGIAAGVGDLLLLEGTESLPCNVAAPYTAIPSLIAARELLVDLSPGRHAMAFRGSGGAKPV